MATKIYNINEMRDAIVYSHNEGLRKAIDKKVCSELGIDATYFNAWIADVKKLKDAVDAYIKIKNNPKTPKDADLKKQASALRKKIFPIWKELLENGEAAKDKKELHVDTADVESLVGYDEEFVWVEGRGRVHTMQTDQLFRKKVEFLLGCKIAQNDFMDEDKRELVSAYQGALRTIDTSTKRIAEIDKDIAKLAALVESLPDVDGVEKVRAALGVQIKDLKKERTDANNRINTATEIKKKKQHDYDTYCACLELAKYNKITSERVEQAKKEVSKDETEEPATAEEAPQVVKEGTTEA